ncbi:uncharacterized protein [Montipora capricornis]|uniref:uncharacterized protein n=1 Tax=Montipora capricornis TaxID=246305 RepID=UPI0035F20B85
MSPGKEFDRNVMLLTQTSQKEYEELCKLDVLGLHNPRDQSQEVVFEEFKERLTRSPEGWYVTTLPRKANHPPPPSIKDGSLKRLHSLNRKLQRKGLTEEYGTIIKEQLAEGVIEEAPPVSQSKEFYIPHKSVVRTAETTKMRIVYDASARATPDSPSLNDCLHPGPALQNRLWDILIQQRGYPGVLAGGVLECHLDAWAKKYPQETDRLRRSFYIDDLLSGGQDVQQARTRKEIATEIMSDASFELHKWHSNEPQLEDRPPSTPYEEQSYAKQQLQAQSSGSKLLGVKWNKEDDTIAVQFPEVVTSRPNERGSPHAVPKVGRVCTSGSDYLKTHSILPRSSLKLHAFGDASTYGVEAAVYSIVRQRGGITQTLVTAKARLAKKDLTIPRLELISAHMAANLVINVRNALKDLPKPAVYGWLDSTVALHWILGNGQYRQFVANRVRKIREHTDIRWRYVPIFDNPADQASRGGQVTNAELWWNGPAWLSDPEKWPDNPVTAKSPASEEEAKPIKEVLNLSQQQHNQDRNEFDELLERNDLRRALRAHAWVLRFTTRRERRGPLTSQDTQEVKEWWIKRVETQDMQKPEFEQTRQILNLVPNEDGVLECHGRIQGKRPMYLPVDATFTRKLVQRIHAETLHGGVSLTMAAVREEYWIPTLRKLVKSVRSTCWGCKRFRALPVRAPPPGLLPKERTDISGDFEVIGTDFAGPILYMLRNKREEKAYLVIFSCSLSRAVHLELATNLETTTFLSCLKRLIARRGRPSVIYSDNGSTFVKAAKWLTQARRDEELNGFLESHDIK